MTPRRSLLAGLGTLVVGLVLVLTIDTDSAMASPRRLVAQGYLANACVLIGSGLVLLSAVLAALRPHAESSPAAGMDHYS